MNATRGARITRLDVVRQAVPTPQTVPDPAVPDPVTPVLTVSPPPTPISIVPDAAPAPVAAPDPFSARARARAELAASYAGILGVDVSRADLLERMAITGGAEITPQVIAGALQAAGLHTKISKPKLLEPSLWPALTEMSSGQVVLVLGQQADLLSVYDTTCPGNKVEVTLAEFLPVFAGTVLRADVSVVELERRHGDAGKAGHWFWGQLQNFRRNILEVAVGSFVANLLAVAVALFSLQVYDRVIPHQSLATLWVLALGAGLAVLLEAFLRIARARLMDGAGRRIEMQVQGMLMDKVLGMQSGHRTQSPSALYSAMREFGAVREFFTASTFGTLTDLPFILLFLALVASIGGDVVWVLVIGGILMVLPSLFLQKRMMALTQQTQGASVKSSRMLHEVIYEADTIKAQRGQDRFRRLWDELTALSSLATSEQRKLAASLTYWSQGAAGDLCDCRRGGHVSGVRGGIYRGHDHCRGHPDFAHAGPADATGGDAVALVQCQGGAGCPRQGSGGAAGRDGGAHISAPGQAARGV